MSTAAHKTTGIIGDGLAGLLLASRLAETQHNSASAITLFGNAVPRPDHVWGYWDSGERFLQPARDTALGDWHQWDIITETGQARLGGGKARYVAVSSAQYEARLADKLAAFDSVTRRQVHIGADSPLADAFDAVFNTANATVEGGLLQHFKGRYITADRPCFDPDTATLMDFRTDQSQGVHFIYLLPFSPTEALIESTVFSEAVCADGWYDRHIDAYLTAQFAGVAFAADRTEAGCIPMAKLRAFGPGQGVGLAGHALRASSGYAFFQIHRQIDAWLQQNGGDMPAGASRVEQWMDTVFLRVLQHKPERAPEIFLRLGQALSGDAFAAFMNGRASPDVLARVIAAVPAWPFVRHVL